jgi:hypothetical protein
MLDYVAPILASYSPGVVLNYTYSDGVMDIVSNMPRDDQAQYISKLNEIHSLYSRRVAPNCQVRMVRINDFYEDEAQLIEELRSNYEFNRQNWEHKYSDDARQRKLKSAKHNLMLDGVEDLTSLSTSELEERYLNAAMWCDALDCLEKRRQFNKFSTNIQVVYVRGPYLSLHLGTCETASMHFWVGTGLVEVRRKRLLQHIASASVVKIMEGEGRVHFVPIDSPLACVSHNFCCIPVLDNCNVE